jgi:hypothetical protein
VVIRLVRANEEVFDGAAEDECEGDEPRWRGAANAELVEGDQRLAAANFASDLALGMRGLLDRLSEEVAGKLPLMHCGSPVRSGSDFGRTRS